jgi:hypothetical protein
MSEPTGQGFDSPREAIIELETASEDAGKAIDAVNKVDIWSVQLMALANQIEAAALSSKYLQISVELAEVRVSLMQAQVRLEDTVVLINSL